jgi:hydroxylamine reductase
MMFSRAAVVRTLTKSVARGVVARNNAVPAVSVAITNMMTRSLSTKPEPKTNIIDSMFCRQCEQTKDHVACTTLGVCGKTSETAACQDALTEGVKSVSVWCVEARKAGLPEEDLQAANVWTLVSTFSTLTNVNFSDTRIAEYILEGQDIKKELMKKVLAAGGSAPSEPVGALDLSGKSVAELEEFGLTVSVPIRQKAMGHDDCFSLNEMATYAMRGLCAYAMHCHQLGKMDAGVMKAVHEIFAKLASNQADMDGLLATVLRVGEVNCTVLAMLDGGHADTYGAPEPTEVCTTAVKGKCILVSGHDMVDLNALLEQCEGTGVNVYTHGEMLPAHGYPKLKAFPHLVGNYGTAWQNQKFEFAAFPGPVIVTTNCIIEPRKMYKDRLYTMNEVGFDGVQHIGPDRDYSAVILQAQQMKGFPKTFEPAAHTTVGFNHRAVLPLAGKVLDAVAAGQLSRIFLIGGCDGSQWNRSYFTDLAEETPDDSLILTLGCAKNRIIHSDKLRGATLANGLPRVLDMGQCNDSYSAVVVATELAKALDCTVNDLPLSLALSHLEQKAAAVLMTLLHLGVKNIRVGPTLPAYITPNVLKILSEKYNVMPTLDPQEDLKAMMQGK